VTRLVQVADGPERRVALVDEPTLRLVEGHRSVYSLAQTAIADGVALSRLAEERATGPSLDYEAIYTGASSWRLMPPIDHPEEAARCLVSGTGLTHVGSARDRHHMHPPSPPASARQAPPSPPALARQAPPSPPALARQAPPSPPASARQVPPLPVSGSFAENGLTDSFRMFEEGLGGGRPAPGAVGVAPEWFYKGIGTMLRAHGEALVVPPYAEDGGEEAEIAGVYVVDREGTPCRVGMAVGNEFSDHRFEKRNYLHLAGSKLRTAALGPELVVNPVFESVAGEVWIERGGTRIWERRIATGEREMCHSLQNLEHHHFKYELHRRPGDVHVHFFGAHSLSFGDGIILQDGDVMAIRFDGFGRPLRNTLRVSPEHPRLVSVRPLG
jgi:hypothetical protein